MSFPYRLSKTEEIECEKHPCKCKVCGVAIEVVVACSYNVEHDPLKLLPLSTCNRCFDYITKTKRQVHQMFKACDKLVATRRGTKPEKLFEAEQKIFETLARITKDYATTVAAYYDCNFWWSEEFPQFFMTQPERAGDVLSNYMTTYKRDVVGPARAQQEMAGLNL